MERLQSGRQTVLYSRVHWAVTYMKNAGLVTSPSRGQTQISEEGRRVLAQAPSRIDLEFLGQYPEFRAFSERTRAQASNAESAPPLKNINVSASADPQERLRLAYAEIRDEVVDAIVERLRNSPSEFLEYVGVELLKKMGYGATGTVTGKSGDRGLDGLVDRDPLGLDTVYLQAKRYAQGVTVGGRDVREFIGAMHQRGATKGVFITTSAFTPEAREAAASTKGGVKLIDGRALGGLLYNHGLGVVADGEPIQLRRLDEGWYPEPDTSPTAAGGEIKTS